MRVKLDQWSSCGRKNYRYSNPFSSRYQVCPESAKVVKWLLHWLEGCWLNPRPLNVLVVYAESQISFWCFIFVACVCASVNNDYPSFYTPLTYMKHPVCFRCNSACFCVLQVQSPCIFRRKESRLTLAPAVIAPSSDKPHLLFNRSTEWFSLRFHFLRYLRDLLPLPTSSTRSSKRRQTQIQKTPVTSRCP